MESTQKIISTIKPLKWKKDAWITANFPTKYQNKVEMLPVQEKTGKGLAM
jgi:hypothetical protein